MVLKYYEVHLIVILLGRFFFHIIIELVEVSSFRMKQATESEKALLGVR